MEMLLLAVAGYFLLSEGSTLAGGSGVNPAGVRTIGGPSPAPGAAPGTPPPSPAVAANGGNVPTELQWAQLIAANADKIGQAGSAVVTLFDSSRAAGGQAPETADVGFGIPGDPANYVEQASFQVGAATPSPWGSFGYTPQPLFDQPAPKRPFTA